MANQSVRVQMSPQTQQFLENLAIENGCLYGGKPHISGLLAQIADGRLAIEKKTPKIPNTIPAPLLRLRICFPPRLRGVLALISQKIADCGGNIVRAKAYSHVDSHVDRDVCWILLSMPEDSDLSHLISELQNLKVKDIYKFNKNGDTILRAIYKTSTVFENTENSDSKVEDSPTLGLSHPVLNRQLLLNINCTIGLRIIAHNKIGLLANITQKIADLGFFNSSVYQDFHADEQIDIIDLVLTLDPEPSSKMVREIEKIRTISGILEKIPEVKHVLPLGVESLWEGNRIQF